ncbi:MAG: AAA family ATPase [Candidatus Methylumidiphilus sp.]
MNPQEPEPLRIRQIRIDGLFGLYNHCINLNLKERVTILHGPNGVGKTVTLKLIEAFLKGDYAEFVLFPFDMFVVTFTDGSVLGLYLSTKQGTSYHGINVNLVTADVNGCHKGYIRVTQSGSRQTHSNLLRLLGRKPNASSTNRLLGDILGENRQQLKASSQVSDLINEISQSAEEEPSWLKNFRAKIGSGGKASIHFIATQRLIRFKDRRSLSGGALTIMEYSRSLKSTIEKTLAQYSLSSQTLDQSFPLRLLSASANPLENDKLKQRMEELEAQRLELQQVGLLDDAPAALFDPAKLDELISQENKVMTLYVQDTEQKLAVFEDLARRIKTLLDNINTKFKNKRLRIDRDKGFVVTTDAKQNLDLDSLSSGEQHEIVLLYDLLFRIKPNTLVLIDEPELSLHVVWQKLFLPDLLKIAEVAQIDVLMATHSPYIVGDHAELMVALETGTSRA